MNYIDNLLNIANDLHLEEQAALLKILKEKLETPNKEILIPLVGLFSSGKSSFINALLDNKILETASKATTATIFEVRFGSESNKQGIIDSEGNFSLVSNDTLSNETLTENQVVCVFDTSTKLDPSIVLVDTPGLSSNNEKHRLALSNYLPNADAILLVVDVNQSVPRSLISFVRDLQISERPFFLMLSKCDTKTLREVELQIKNTVDVVGIPEDHIICTSSQTNNLEQFFELIKKIQVHKNEIVANSIKGRVRLIAEQMKDFVQDLLNGIDSSKNLESTIADQTRRLKQLSTNIDNLIDDASEAIRKKEEVAVHIFKKRVSQNLDSILQSEGRDCDQSVYASVNSVGSMVIDQFRQDIQSVLINLGRERRRTSKEVPMQSLETIDLSGIVFNKFSYDLDLSNAGHEHDKIYGYAALVVAAAATVALAAPVVAGAAGTTGAAAGAGAAGNTMGTAIIGETGEIIGGTVIGRSIVKAQRCAKKAQKFVGDVSEKIDDFQKVEQAIQQKTETDRGLIETATGWITDKIIGKPARVRAVNNYLDETLIPQFKLLLSNVRTNLTRVISNTIHQEAESLIASMKQSLSQMNEQLDNARQDASERRNILKSYIEILNGCK